MSGESKQGNQKAGARWGRRNGCGVEPSSAISAARCRGWVKFCWSGTNRGASRFAAGLSAGVPSGSLCKVLVAAATDTLQLLREV